MKLLIIGLFIYLAVFHINAANWHPFIPFGWSGVVTGAAIAFFAYIGFDAVSTAAEEVENPQKNLPMGILGSLAICTILYIVVSAVLTGIVPYSELGSTNAPVAFALTHIGIAWGSALVSVGAICGITSVLIVTMYGQTRIFFAMARDGLLPQFFSEVHPTLKTPVKITFLLGVATAFISSLFSLEVVTQLVNIGTLAAFIIVSAGVIVLRKTQPNLQRPFKCPLVPYVPLLCMVSCGALIVALPTITHLRFVIWLALGLIIYLFYGRYHCTIR
jgi:APA family basic amino acid/polyamine antiporter